MIKPTKDLFDDSTMTFGEHLEVLRKHLILALAGLTVSVVICLYQGERLVDFVRAPIDNALREYAKPAPVGGRTSWEQMKQDWGLNVAYHYFEGTANWWRGVKTPEQIEAEIEHRHPEQVKVAVPVNDLIVALREIAPDQFREPAAPVASEEKKAPEKAEEVAVTSPPAAGDGGTAAPATTSEEAQKTVQLTLIAPQFAQFNETVEQSRRPVTFNVQEAFMTYLKVSLIGGVLLASPWIFYQAWLFVSAGLYPHERKYVHVYGAMSLGLFLLGAVFCFYGVFPFVLHFLLNFNKELQIHPQIRLSEWISFAVMLPVMFGISFQLPLVMLFLERISIFSVTVYREQRRMAILAIAILSAILTPADPASMLMMMFPLIVLYELGIRLCDWLPRGGFQRLEESHALVGQN